MGHRLLLGARRRCVAVLWRGCHFLYANESFLWSVTGLIRCDSSTSLNIRQSKRSETNARFGRREGLRIRVAGRRYRGLRHKGQQGTIASTREKRLNLLLCAAVVRVRSPLSTCDAHSLARDDTHATRRPVRYSQVVRLPHSLAWMHLTARSSGGLIPSASVSTTAAVSWQLAHVP